MVRERWILALMVACGCTEANPFLGVSETSSAGGDGSTGGMSSTAPSSTTTVGATTDDGATTMAQSDATTDGSADSTASTGSTGDAPMVCDESSHRCVPPPPVGWLGPVALLENPADEETPRCAGEYPVFGMEVYDDLQAPPQECDCECGAPNNATCGPALVQRWAAANCNGAATTTWNIDACTNAATQVGNRFRATATVDGGTCTAMPTAVVPEAGFTTRLTACGVASIEMGGCDGADLCLPSPEEPLDGRVCIWQPGNLECPDGGWTDRQVLHESFADDRACSPCSCGNAQGSCTGSMRLATVQCGSQLMATQFIAFGNACTASTVGTGSISFSGAITPSNPSCTPTNSTPIGDAEALSPITVCCQG